MRTTALAALGIAIIAAACSASAATPTWTFAPEAAPDSAALVSGQATAQPTEALASASAVPSASAAPSATADVLGSVAGTPSGTGGASAAAPMQGSVQIANFAFGPETVTIHAGGTVTWTNDDGDRHSVLLEGSESGRLDTGGTFSRSFADAGQFAYVCGLHSSMTGTVVVLAAGSSAGGSGAAPTGTTRPGPTGTTPPGPTAAPTASSDDRDDGDDDESDDDDDDHSGHGGGGSGHG